MWYLHPFVCSWHVWLKIELKPKQNIQRVNFRLHSPLHLCMLVNEFCFDIIIYDFMKRCFIGIIRWYNPQDINIVISSLVTLLCQNSNMVNILFAKYLLGKKWNSISLVKDLLLQLLQPNLFSFVFLPCNIYVNCKREIWQVLAIL